ncbi:ASCH domain-containing protein [Engelhardtia mirabilis]|uniref:ASCH domain protein n=1 Tax=Engelhardtia mirabilis TaxID=2528011 RepID=A0A518BL35_9BACT|nr:hypothetical protein Pla133_27650 [Planctomycetes bacterium Pla133]QDV02003.1 hypothetical protein Pla86_27640 [Planctomycetes bacterium Pla86]
MRLISFSMTEPQILDRSKTVTRRTGWRHAKAGDLLRGVHKCMGFKPGEKPRTLATVRVVEVRRERLDAITDQDVAREGYPGQSADWFVAKFCQAMRCTPETEVARIEFEYVDEGEGGGAR